MPSRSSDPMPLLACAPLLQLSVEKDKGGEVAAELAALCMVRLTRITPDISAQIAEKGGIAPLVMLLSEGTPGAQQQAACVLAELALVPRNRDMIAHAGGIAQLIDLLVAPCVGTPEVAARCLSHIALFDVSGGGGKGGVAEGAGGAAEAAVAGAAAMGGGEEKAAGKDKDKVFGSDERRGMIATAGGVKRLISMLDNSNLLGAKSEYSRIRTALPMHCLALRLKWL